MFPLDFYTVTHIASFLTPKERYVPNSHNVYIIDSANSLGFRATCKLFYAAHSTFVPRMATLSHIPDAYTQAPLMDTPTRHSLNVLANPAYPLDKNQLPELFAALNYKLGVIHPDDNDSIDLELCTILGHIYKIYFDCASKGDHNHGDHFTGLLRYRNTTQSEQVVAIDHSLPLKIAMAYNADILDKLFQHHNLYQWTPFIHIHEAFSGQYAHMLLKLWKSKGVSSATCLMLMMDRQTKKLIIPYLDLEDLYYVDIRSFIQRNTLIFELLIKRAKELPLDADRRNNYLQIVDVESILNNESMRNMISGLHHVEYFAYVGLMKFTPSEVYRLAKGCGRDVFEVIRCYDPDVFIEESVDDLKRLIKNEPEGEEMRYVFIYKKRFGLDAFMYKHCTCLSIMNANPNAIPFTNLVHVDNIELVYHPQMQIKRVAWFFIWCMKHYQSACYYIYSHLPAKRWKLVRRIIRAKCSDEHWEALAAFLDHIRKHEGPFYTMRN